MQSQLSCPTIYGDKKYRRENHLVSSKSKEVSGKVKFRPTCIQGSFQFSNTHECLQNLSKTLASIAQQICLVISVIKVERSSLLSSIVLNTQRFFRVCTVNGNACFSTSSTPCEILWAQACSPEQREQDLVFVFKHCQL